MRALPLIFLAACACAAPSPRQQGTAQVPEDGEDVSPSTLGAEDAGPAPALAHAFPSQALRSRFAEGSGAQALARYRRQEFTLAREAVTRALAEAESEEQKASLRILEAVIERDSGRWAQAATLFAEAAADPLLADYMNFQAARAYARADSPLAAKHAAKVSASSPWASDSEFLLAEAARASGKKAQAAEGYRRYLDSGPDAALADEARFRLGESLLALGKRDEGLVAWRKLALSSPVASFSEQARQAEPTLEAHLNGSELIERGMGYFRAMRNLESEADFEAALADTGLSAEQRCQALFHRAKSVYKERQYKRSAPLFVPAIDACKTSGNTDYEVKSAYQAGLAFSRARDRERAVKHYAYVEQYPEHSYADDARLRQAEEYEDLKNEAKVTELLSNLPELYPEGDMRGVAMWRLARHAYQAGEYEQAVGWLNKQIEVVPIEINWWAEGQAHYWLGRSLAHLGKIKEAAEAYVECIRRYPLTYYSMQAFNRLRESWPEVYAQALEEVKTSESPWNNQLQARPIYGAPAFATGLALAQLGLSDAARRQLASIGFETPKGRDPERDPERLDWLVATTLLLDLAGDYEHSHWIGRWHTIDYRRSWPNGDNALRWRLAYPLAFWDLLQEFAERYTYPAHLQMAIVREESAFDPARESYANAVGLTQMIFPTARDHSVGSGIKVTRENLQHPVKNVTIGSHFLESLQQAFEGRVGLMVPGYNAGRARVRSWIRSRNRYDLDEFIERIRGDQARRYTKRVLGSFFVYRYLSSGEVPVVRNAVPRRLGRR